VANITQEILEETFGSGLEKARAFKEINYIPLFMFTYMYIDKIQELFACGLAQAEALLSKAVTELEA